MTKLRISYIIVLLTVYAGSQAVYKPIPVVRTPLATVDTVVTAGKKWLDARKKWLDAREYLKQAAMDFEKTGNTYVTSEANYAVLFKMLKDYAKNKGFNLINHTEFMLGRGKGNYFMVVDNYRDYLQEKDIAKE